MPKENDSKIIYTTHFLQFFSPLVYLSSDIPLDLTSCWGRGGVEVGTTCPNCPNNNQQVRRGWRRATIWDSPPPPKQE